MKGSQIYDTPEDPRLLLKMAQDRSVQGRKALVNTISDLFSERASGLSEREHALMNDILGKLVHDFEMSVRQELAERLAARENAPHELIVALANDEIEVARPILMESSVLETPELIEIIKNRTREHQLAIAMRRSVNEIISDALVENDLAMAHAYFLKALQAEPRGSYVWANLGVVYNQIGRAHV